MCRLYFQLKREGIRFILKEQIKTPVIIRPIPFVWPMKTFTATETLPNLRQAEESDLMDLKAILLPDL